LSKGGWASNTETESVRETKETGNGLSEATLEEKVEHRDFATKGN